MLGPPDWSNHLFKSVPALGVDKPIALATALPVRRAVRRPPMLPYWGIILIGLVGDTGRIRAPGDAEESGADYYRAKFHMVPPRKSLHSCAL
jgi:hypothetical protein